MADPDARRRAEEALAEIAAGDHGEYCGLRNGMLLSGGKTECYSDCPKRVAKEALEALLAAGPEAPPPPSDAVREAVMAGAELLSAVRGAPTGSIGAIDNTYLPQIGREWLRPIEERIDAGVSALAASPATLATVTVPAGVAGPDDPIRVRLVPDDAAVREAAEVVRTILTAHDARLSESGALTYGPPSKGTGFVAAIQWLRRYDAARGGE